MVVKYNYLSCLSEELRTLCVAWPVGIHHHDKRILAHHLEGLLTIYKHVCWIALYLRKSLHERSYRACRVIYDYLRLFVEILGCTVYTYASSERVYICDAVTHDKHILTGLNNLLKRLRLDSRLYPCLALHLL